jgi:hypothetical protein
MKHHDLSTKEGRKAHRHELRMVAVRPRRWGLWLLTAGFLLLLTPSALNLHSWARSASLQVPLCWWRAWC